MGWTYQQKPRNVKQYLKDELTWERDGKAVTCLEIKIVELKTAYAAVQISTDPEEVIGMVIMLDYCKDPAGFTFGTKFVDESMGPYHYKCPVSILDKLTPTDNHYARDWRIMCRNYHNQRKLNNMKKKAGTYLKPKEGLDDQPRTHIDLNGQQVSLFKVVEWKPRKLALQVADQHPAKLYRMTNEFLSDLKICEKPSTAIV